MRRETSPGSGVACIVGPVEPFREFYLHRTGITYPGLVGEQTSVVLKRALDQLADYADEIARHCP